MKKTLTIILIFLILAVSAYAQESADSINTKGIVTVTITNAPPSITKLSFSSEKVYADSKLKCNLEVWDDQPGTLVSYNWYKNGLLLDEKSDTLSGFEDNDEIKCAAIAKDVFGEIGEEKVVSVIVEETTHVTKSAQFIVNSFGAEKNLAEISAVKDQGLMALTGYVVSESVKTPSAVMFFAVFIGVLLLVMLNLVLRRTLSKANT
ncbi:MAG: hypothetical protein KJ583_06145 [Nanoarchaeota archaeon]|nr:hypothetical protein [Nanoarchaeota archaeon]